MVVLDDEAPDIWLLILVPGWEAKEGAKILSGQLVREKLEICLQAKKDNEIKRQNMDHDNFIHCLILE